MADIPSAITDYTDQSLSTVHHALRPARRRLVIGLVAHRAIKSSSSGKPPADTHPRETETETVVTVRQLSREIVAIEEDVSIEHATGEPYHNVYTALIQTHLPELADIGAVEYDPDRKTVTPDRNLIALAMVAAITSPVAQTLFHDAVADLYSNNLHSPD